MESLAREYRTKTQHFVAYLLGYEASGSLTSYLRKKFVILLFNVDVRPINDLSLSEIGDSN